jgi:hypothetical protein
LANYGPETFQATSRISADYKMLAENNTRDRILSVEELERLLGYLPPMLPG